ncbi:MAG: prenyltransferase/squalene oxidase repeat-containing protein [Planctomycetota bacterium]
MDPTKLQLEHHHRNPLLDNEPTFQEIMADQLAHAPWLALSIAIHAVVVLLLWLIPAETRLAEEVKTTMAIKPPEQEIVEEEKPEEKPEEEVPEEEPTLQDAEVAENEQPEAETFEATESSVESAFDSNAWNTAVGLGGGAAGKFGGRAGGRGKLGGRGGKLTAQAIEAGLQWLKDHQDEDGKWDADEFMKHDEDGTPCTGPGDPLHDVGVTGLALLAFLGDGSTMKSGPYKDVIKSGIIWLRSQQDEDTGLIGTEASHHFIYDHVIATLAMCEAFGLSNYRSLRGNAQKAINYLEAHRNPYGCWRYQKQGGDSDISVTGWAVLAYISAKEFHLQIDKKALEYADSYIDQMTDANGRTGYIEKGGLSSRHKGQHELDFPAERTECMTAVGLLCKYFLGHDPKKDPMMESQAKVLMKKPPQWVKDTKGSWVDHYYWYYGTYAMYQVGGSQWDQWSKSVNDAVVKHQRTDENFKGSWDPEDAWGQDGGRVYATAILVLTLEAYYRYSRVLGGR